MKKKFLSALLAALMLVSVTACGEDKEPDYDKIGEDIENMSDDELEKAILDGADMLS